MSILIVVVLLVAGLAVFVASRPDQFRVERSALTPYGETRTPGLADLFVATMKGTYA